MQGLLSSILTVWPIESHTHPITSGKLSSSNIFHCSHSKQSVYFHHHLDNKVRILRVYNIEKSGYTEYPKEVRILQVYSKKVRIPRDYNNESLSIQI